jgi:aerobic-type carbon monoxide dehydrogenase small subunit (CoxS/CutS family)
MARYDLRVNGFARFAEADDPDKPLLYVLREMGLTAAKYGCGLGQCGACTVLIDGAPARSCQTAASRAGRFHQGAGPAMRLLHRRDDNDFGCAA